MTSGGTDFCLPLGLSWEGKVYRTGRMRLATTRDELELQGTDEAELNSRYRDIQLFSRVIEGFEALKPVTIQMVESLYEADFLYLQLLYKELNGETAKQITSVCQKCGERYEVNIPLLYEDMSVYQPKEGGKE